MHERELKALMRRVQLLVGSSVAIPEEVTPMPPMDDGTAVVLLLLAGGAEEENRTHSALDAVAEFGRHHCDGGGGNRGAELSYTLLSRASFVFAGSPSVAGAHSAVVTLEQLAKPSRARVRGRSAKPARKPSGRSRPLPPIFIADQPAYGWRGFHLDVARHFFKMPTPTP